MTSEDAGSLPWETIGQALEPLFEYERRIGYYERASYDLMSVIVHGLEDSPWRRFLLRDGNLAAIARQVVAISQSDSAPVDQALADTRELVEAWLERAPDSPLLLDKYVVLRSSLPRDARDRLDAEAKAGSEEVLHGAVAMASEVQLLKGEGDLDGASGDIFDHWYHEIADGRLPPDRAAKVPAQVLEARDRLVAHLRKVKRNDGIGADTVYATQGGVLKAPDIPAAVEIIEDVSRFGLLDDTQRIEPFLRKLPAAEARGRLERLGDWARSYTPYDHGTVQLTPPLAEYLSGPSDFESMLAELDRLRVETHEGRFDANNVLQRDLEFRRYVHEDDMLNGTQRTLPYVVHSIDERYRRFSELKMLPPQEEEGTFTLEGQHLRQADRLTYETAGFLRFLRELRSSTSRPIVVVGNDRYGRQWVVEPLAELLRGDFTVQYDRVASHMSMKLRVPSARLHEKGMDESGNWTPNAFPREFVEEIGETMPHIVIADGMSPGERDGMRVSRGQKNYANWVVAFNDVRAEGDGTKYQHECCFPSDHYPELLRWYEFVLLRRQLVQWTTPGQTYKIAMWAPQTTDMVHLGEVRVPYVAPDLESDRPQVILANPIIYATEGDRLPPDLQGTRPYYFDGPERHVEEEIELGFGPYGFQPRVVGTMTSTFVMAVQRHVRERVEQALQAM